jgi:inosine-uridine nucleoside N-ribohydrolase
MRESRLLFKVPDTKRVRMIVYTDCKNEADDQFALAHHLMTPKFIVTGIVAGHFDLNPQQYGKGQTAKASEGEVRKILSLMDMEDVPVYLGAESPITNENTPALSDGARYIIEEALRDDMHPLYIACQGAVTDLASAIIARPEICDRMTAIWIGGGKYPKGGFEFNAKQDIAAANVLLKSKMPLWQIPINVYKQVTVSLSELQLNVAPCGEIGNYLFRQMLDMNERCADIPHWPNGETWGLGDSPTIGVLLEETEKTDIYDVIDAPSIRYYDMTYNYEGAHGKIRVYKKVNDRLILGDFFAKLKINYGQ